MNNSTKKRIWIYAVCIVVTAALMFSLNYLLQLPAIIPIIGDENTWLPIIVDSIIAAVIFIAGNWISNEERLRNEILARKEDYNVVRESVCRVQSALNIKRKQLYFIYSLDVNMNSRSLLSEIMQVQQEIEDSINDFTQIKYVIKSKKELLEFEKTYKEIENSFQIVLDGLMCTVNKWCDTQAKSVQASTVADLIGRNSDKTEYATLYANSCIELEKHKGMFLSTYKSQEKTLNYLLNSLNQAVNKLLTTESELIKELESNI